MNRLCRLIKPDNVLLGIAPSSKKRIFEQAAQTLSLLYDVNKKEVFDALFARERLGSTYLDHGLALPHCRLSSLKEPCCLFMRLHGGLEGSRPGDPPVSSLLFLLVPESATSEHLELLSEAAALFSSEETRENLMNQTTAEGFCSKLHEWCEKHAQQAK